MPVRILFVSAQTCQFWRCRRCCRTSGIGPCLGSRNSAPIPREAVCVAACIAISARQAEQGLGANALSHSSAPPFFFGRVAQVGVRLGPRKATHGIVGLPPKFGLFIVFDSSRDWLLPTHNFSRMGWLDHRNRIGNEYRNLAPAAGRRPAFKTIRRISTLDPSHIWCRSAAVRDGGRDRPPSLGGLAYEHTRRTVGWR